MGEKLTSMLLAGLISFPCFGSSTNLENTVISSKGYEVYLAREIDCDRTNHITTMIDKDSEMNVIDLGNDGMNSDDYLTFSHKFSTREKLKFRITYKGNDHYLSKAELYSPKDKKLVECDLDTREVNSIIYYFVKKMTRSTVEKTKENYSKLYESAIVGITTDIPYSEIKNGLTWYESFLSEARQNDKKFKGSLVQLAKKYMEIINQKKSSSVVELLFSSNDSPSENSKNN